MTGPLAVLPALALDAGWRGLACALGRRGAAIGTALVVLLLGFVVHANYTDYFTVQVTTYQQPDRWVLLSRFIESINSRYRVFYVGDRPESSLTFQTAGARRPGPALAPDPHHDLPRRSGDQQKHGLILAGRPRHALLGLLSGHEEPNAESVPHVLVDD